MNGIVSGIDRNIYLSTDHYPLPEIPSESLPQYCQCWEETLAAIQAKKPKPKKKGPVRRENKRFKGGAVIQKDSASAIIQAKRKQDKGSLTPYTGISDLEHIQKFRHKSNCRYWARGCWIPKLPQELFQVKVVLNREEKERQEITHNREVEKKKASHQIRRARCMEMIKEYSQLIQVFTNKKYLIDHPTECSTSDLDEEDSIIDEIDKTRKYHTGKYLDSKKDIEANTESKEVEEGTYSSTFFESNLDNQLAELYIRRATLYGISNFYDKAVEDAKTSLSHCQAFPSAFYQLGLNLMKLNRKKEALDAFKDGRQLFPTSVELNTTYQKCVANINKDSRVRPSSAYKKKSLKDLVEGNIEARSLKLIDATIPRKGEVEQEENKESIP